MIDYENYKVYDWTDKQLKKRYSSEILDKYYKQLAFLFQNGYKMDCATIEEADEQFDLWNGFSTYEDFEEMINLYKNKPTEFSVGKKIISEELYDILKEVGFSKIEVDDPVYIKKYATTYWNNIGLIIERLEQLFNCKDLELVESFKKVTISYSNIIEKLSKLKEIYAKEIKVLTWMKFVELSNIIYSFYVQFTKIKTDHINISKASNLNDELYGGIGGFEPNSGKIKCIIGSAVWETKTIKNITSIIKLKSVAGSILKDTKKTKEDDKYIEFLERWYAGKETNDELARRIVVNSLLWGIMTLLCLKHNFNLIESDKRNGRRSDQIHNEFGKIMEYCGIEKEYLL